MTAEEITAQLLNASPEVVALVSTRIYPDTAIEDVEYPYIVFQRPDSNPTWTIHGDLACDEVTMHIAGWARTRLEADEIGAAITSAMRTGGCIYVARTALYDDDLALHSVELDFQVWEGIG